MDRLAKWMQVMKKIINSKKSLDSIGFLKKPQ